MEGMTPEERFERVERILGYFVREGRRWRVRKREQDEKINILIQAQMETTEQINKTTQQINKLTAETNEQINKLTAETTEQISKLAADTAASHAIHNEEMADLRRSQQLTDKTLRAFIDSLRKGRNGSSSD